jgi:MoaA/NifB/PqqE/SkfB family radical SAM enzyme
MSGDNMEVFGQYVNHVEIEIFSYCNRKCAFCANSYIDRQSKNIFMPPKTFSKIIDELAVVNYEDLIFFAHYNEPLADRVILERLREAREKLPKATFYLNTNGDFLTREYLDDLADAGLNQIFIMQYPSPNKEFSIVEQERIIKKFADKLGLEYENISCTNIRCFHPKLMIDICSPDIKCFNSRAGSVDFLKNKNLRTDPCRSPFMAVYIGYDGSVTPCCASRHDVPQHKDMIMGNVGEQTLFDIFMSHKWSLLRYQMKDFGAKKVYPCCVCNDTNHDRTRMPPVEETNRFSNWNLKEEK